MAKRNILLDRLLDKYSGYVSNIDWHIKTNKPEGEELRNCALRLNDFKEVVADLENVKKTLLRKKLKQ